MLLPKLNIYGSSFTQKIYLSYPASALFLDIKQNSRKEFPRMTYNVSFFGGGGRFLWHT